MGWSRSFEAQRTVTTMTELGKLPRIGEVRLIQAIAGQTNLLALNATIEAARAGDPARICRGGGGGEIPRRATAKATEEIAEQIGSIQLRRRASQAIEQVDAIIREMSSIVTMVAATVDEQNSAVASIAEGVGRASSEAHRREAMSRVAALLLKPVLRSAQGSRRLDRG
jgi:methyl-accepting chemotaxis protein